MFCQCEVPVSVFVSCEPFFKSYIQERKRDLPFLRAVCAFVVWVSLTLEEVNVKVVSYPMLSDLRMRVALWKVPRLCPFVLVRATCRCRLVWNVGGMILTGETEVLARET